MTEQILRDRELDRLVAEKVMGWVDFWMNGEGLYLMGYPPNEQKMGLDAERHPVPRYSTDIAAAWQVVDHLRSRGDFWLLELCVSSTRCWCRFAVEGSKGKPLRARASSAPHAICLAALKAVGIEEEE